VTLNKKKKVPLTHQVIIIIIIIVWKFSSCLTTKREPPVRLYINDKGGGSERKNKLPFTNTMAMTEGWWGGRKI